MSVNNLAAEKIKKYSFTDLCRKIIYVLLRYLKNTRSFLRRVRFYFFTKCWVSSILGKVYFNTICNSVSVGKHATLYPFVVFELAENAKVVIGNNFTLSYGAIFSCRYSVKIGDFVMIGEYSSIRDTTHAHENPGVPYCQQPDKFEEIIIGDNVWIGRGCLILPGSIIENGVIVGAHSVVKGRLKANCMYAGSPLKMVREMSEKA